MDGLSLDGDRCIRMIPRQGEVYVFTGVCDSVHRGACMVAGGQCMVARGRGHAWFLEGEGGVHGFQGACMVAGGHAWLLRGMCGCQGGGMRGCWGCAWFLGWQRGHAWQRGCGKGGMHGKGEACMAKGGHVWDMMRYRDTINERAVRILLECILVT